VQAEITDPRWGTYRQRGQALGIPILAFDCVCQEAVAVAAHIIESMLADADSSVVQAMVDGGAEVAIIGRNQVCNLGSTARGPMVLPAWCATWGPQPGDLWYCLRGVQLGVHSQGTYGTACVVCKLGSTARGPMVLPAWRNGLCQGWSQVQQPVSFATLLNRWLLTAGHNRPPHVPSPAWNQLRERGW
jgi:hypothetical protein